MVGKPLCCLTRNAWLFFGNDDHAHAAANLFSLMAGCRLHGLDPEQYLSEVIHVMPHWPRDGCIEWTLRYQAATRVRLNPAELIEEYRRITVPPAQTLDQKLPSN